MNTHCEGVRRIYDEGYRSLRAEVRHLLAIHSALQTDPVVHRELLRSASCGVVKGFARFLTHLERFAPFCGSSDD